MRTTATLRFTPFVAALVCAVSAHAQNPIPNPGFETWANENPVGWSTSNNEFGGYPVTQNPTGHAGSTAARGTFLSQMAAPVMNLYNEAFQPLSIPQAYEHLTFYYQLQLGSTEGIEIFTASAQFTDAIGYAVGQTFQIFDRTANTSTWAFADLPITTVAQGTAAVNVSFTLSGPDAVAGSYFVVDDVALSNGASSVAELGQGGVLGAAWPVPATDAVNLPFTVDAYTAVQVVVYDAVGRGVDREELGDLAPGRYKQVVDVQGWPNGMYTAVLRTAQGSQAQHFVVAH